MEKLGLVEARSKVAILAGESQREMVDAVESASKGTDLGFDVVSADDVHHLAVLIGCSPDENLVREYGWREPQESHSARLLELHTQLERPDAGRLVGRYVLRIVTADGKSGPIVVERRISIGPDGAVEQLLSSLDWAARMYLPGDIGDFAKKTGHLIVILNDMWYNEI
jgi:hypothetical protein